MVDASAKSFATYHSTHQPPCLSIPFTKPKTYLSNPSNIFIPILLTEPQILIQPKPHIITIQPVRRETEVQ